MGCKPSADRKGYADAEGDTVINPSPEPGARKLIRANHFTLQLGFNFILVMVKFIHNLINVRGRAAFRNVSFQL